MVRVTLRVLDGADRGRAFESLETPVTIGREEGNVIQLNDERVSRFHVKIQSDGDRLVLTDLESTNGTKVNGEDVRLRVLRFGDLIQVGRTMILLGSREQIEERLARLPAQESKGWFKFRKSTVGEESQSSSDSENPWPDAENLQDFLFNHEPPELPEDLTPTQAAQLSELVDYLRIRIRSLVASVKEEKSGRMSLDAADWQKLLDLQSRLAEFVREIGEPDGSE
jgi:predicted component of type VI protein secretion system